MDDSKPNPSGESGARRLLRLARVIGGWIIVVLIAGFLTGLVLGMREIIAHRYLSYGLYPLSLQILVEYWELAARRIAQFVFVFAALHAASTLAGPWIERGILRVGVVNRNRFAGFVLALLGGAFVFFRMTFVAVTGEAPSLRGPRSLFEALARLFEELAILDSASLLLVPAATGIAVFLLGGMIAGRLRAGDLVLLAGRLVTSRTAALCALASVLIFTGAFVFENRLVAAAIGKKNIIFISIDTLRARNLGCYGYGRDTSPRIDAFAERSVLFENAYTTWPKTTPAVASLMTGLYAHTNGVLRLAPFQYLRDDLLMLAEILRNSGYRTEGNIANGVIGIEANVHQGFDRFGEKMGTADNVTRGALWSIDRLADRREKNPFFYWVHYVDPHTTYDPPDSTDYFVGDRFYDPAERVRIEEGAFDLVPIEPGLSGYEENRRLHINRADLGCTGPGIIHEKNEILAHYVALYDAEIRYVDRHVGMVLDRLEERGLLENSIVVLWSDHGESLGEHNYYFRHGRFPYNVNLEVPLIVYDADQPARVVDHAISLLDVTPTLLDLAGIEHPTEFEGRSFAGEVRGEGSEPRDIFAESGYAVNYQKTLIRDNWKLIYIPDELDRTLMTGAEFELYDLAEDPDELVNVSALHPAVFAEMKTALLAWIATWEDDLVEKGVQDVDYSEAKMNELRALGYVD
ncbi:MAG: sulfatase-like hydrolase/transferase [Gemmatimonadetes bacterium]|nr:sulfatase-like hydrolase/transferase [Gemmatimonadota bacterium]